MVAFRNETTGRICYAVEVDAAYVDVAVLRWQGFSGQEAGLEGDGRSFAAVQAERLAENSGGETA